MFHAIKNNRFSYEKFLKKVIKNPETFNLIKSFLGDMYIFLYQESIDLNLDKDFYYTFYNLHTHLYLNEIKILKDLDEINNKKELIL